MPPKRLRMRARRAIPEMIIPSDHDEIPIRIALVVYLCDRARICFPPEQNWRDPKLDSWPSRGRGVAARCRQKIRLYPNGRGVFREGAENGTRGACAPHLDFGFRDERPAGQSKVCQPAEFTPLRCTLMNVGPPPSNIAIPYSPTRPTGRVPTACGCTEL